LRRVPSGRSGHREPPATKRSRFGPLRSAALRRLLITAALTNAALSATEVALTAYVRYHNALWASGPLLAEISIGSIVGSVFLAYRGYRLSRLLAGYAIGLTVLTAAGLYARLVVVAAPLAGLCLGPTLATLFGAAAPRCAARSRHRDPGLDQLDHERRRGRRGRAGRGRLDPARPRPRRGRGRRGHGRRCRWHAPRSVRKE
jgi:hypothetical protein